MRKFIYRNKGFTLIELLVYLGVVTIAFILILAIMYGIIYYTSFYFESTLLRNEMFKVLQKIYYNTILAKEIEMTSSSVKFINPDQNYEKLFASGTNLYLETPNLVDKFSSDKIQLDQFQVSTSGSYIHIFINFKNLKGDQNLSATSVIYKLQF